MTNIAKLDQYGLLQVTGERRARVPARAADQRRREPRARAGALRRLVLGQGPAAGDFSRRAQRRRLPAAALARPRARGGQAPVDVRPALQGEDRGCERAMAAVRPLGARASGDRLSVSENDGCDRGPDRCRTGPCVLAPQASIAPSEPNAAASDWALAEIRAGRPLISAGDAGPVRAADGEPRAGRRRGFQEGLLPGTGNRRARAVPRRGEAAHGTGCAARRCSRDRNSTRRRAGRGERHGRQCRRRRIAGGVADRRDRGKSPIRAQPQSAALEVLPLPYSQ